MVFDFIPQESPRACDASIPLQKVSCVAQHIEGHSLMRAILIYRGHSHYKENS